MYNAGVRSPLDIKKVRVFVNQKVQKGEERRRRKPNDIVEVTLDFPDQESTQSLRHRQYMIGGERTEHSLPEWQIHLHDRLLRRCRRRPAGRAAGYPKSTPMCARRSIFEQSRL